MKPQLSIFLIIILISSSFTTVLAQQPPTVNIPPTNAYAHIKTSNSTANSTYFDDTTKFNSGAGMKITSGTKGNIYFSSTVSNGTTIHPITCSLNYQIHQVNSSGYFFCALNNNTGSGSTLDTIVNVTPAMAYFFQKNTTNTNFAFRGINITGSECSISNSSTLVSLYCKTWQNNTGTNLGTHGSGVFDSMLGSALQFLKLVSQYGISISTNSTNVILNLAIKVNNQTCTGGTHFLQTFDNVTGNLICGTVSGFLTQAITSINGDTTAAQLITAGRAITVTDTGATHKITNTGVAQLTATSPLTVNQTTGSVNVSCPTCSTGTLTGSGKSPFLTYWNSTTSINQTKNLQWDSTNKVLKPDVDYGSNLGDNTTRFNHVNARNVTASNSAYQNSSRLIDTITATSPLTVTKSGGIEYLKCPTCSTTTGTIVGSYNDGVNPGSFGVLDKSANSRIVGKNMSALRNVNIYSTATDLTVSANNTAYARNIFSNSGTSGGSGAGFFLNNTNTTMINLKTLVSTTPTFTKIQTNNTNVNLNSSVPASNVVDIWDSTIGDYTTPSSSANSTEKRSSINDCSAGGTTLGTGTVFTSSKLTGLLPGQTYYSEGIDVNTAANNIRLKVYQDDGASGAPSTLLAQTGSTAVSATGWMDIALTSSFNVPASGNVWLAVETDGASFSTCFQTVGSGVAKKVAHTYGTGPSPFGTAVASTIGVYMRIGYPSLLAIDGSTSTPWVSQSEVNPWIYVDTGSAQILSGAAIYWNSTSTATQILIQTSTDHVTWNTKRTVNTNLLTNGAWNFIRWNLDTSTERYVRFYGNDGSAKTLYIWELKVLIPSATVLEMRHGHEPISISDGTLPLSQ